VSYIYLHTILYLGLVILLYWDVLSRRTADTFEHTSAAE
jgi:hypothetical protein